MAIIDNAHAKGLFPQGRCVMQWTDEFQMQVPYISEQFVDETVDGAILGKFRSIDVTAHDITEQEVMQWALDNDFGYLSVSRIFQNFRPRGITRAELQDWFERWEGTEVIVGSSAYIVEPASGSRARRLVSMDNRTTTTTNEPIPPA